MDILSCDISWAFSEEAGGIWDVKTDYYCSASWLIAYNSLKAAT